VEKIWLKSYPHGVPEQVPTPEFRSIRELIEHSFQEYPENPAYTNMGTTITYRDLDELSMQFACYLQKNLGMTRGERVAIMLPNIIQYPVAMCGAFRAGLVVVNVNPLYTARELKHQLSDSGAKCIVILENFAHILEEVIDDTEVEHVITTGVGDLLSFPKNLLVNFVLRHVKREVPRYKFGNSVTFRHALRDGANEQLRTCSTRAALPAYPRAPCSATATWSTTLSNPYAGRAKPTTAWNLWSPSRRCRSTALPLYHIFSLQGNCLLVMAQGGLNVLITNPRDMPGFVKEISKFRFNLLTGVNTMFAGLLNTPGFSDIEFSPLRVVVGGGMAVQPAVAREWHKVTGKPILQGYGLTETSPAAVCNTIDSEFTGSIGLPIPSTEAMIAGDDGNELHVGEIGEICLKGPQVMEGYWQRPAETAEVMLPGGWLRTGDIGRMDEDGFIYIEDRKKDMILVSGFNVYPNEIENVVVEMDGILEAAAIGVADEKSGEVVKVFAVRTNQNTTERDVIEHCRENLTGYKRPKIVEFRDELPKTNVGKILRRALRDE
jgi:long-chain acyl-CoA synthetase